MTRGGEPLEFSVTAEKDEVIRWPIGDLPPTYWNYRTERVRPVATAMKCATAVAVIGLLVAFGDSATAKDLLELLKTIREMMD